MRGKGLIDVYKRLSTPKPLPIQRQFPELKRKTFLDHPDAKEINAPFYSYDHAPFKVISKYGGNKLPLREVQQELRQVFQKTATKILTEIKKTKAKVVFAYMPFPDAIHHLQHHHLPILKHYIELDRFVNKLKQAMPTNATLIILSDHGFDIQKCNHTTYGFYSTNKKLNPKPQKITDFTKIIEKELSKHD